MVSILLGETSYFGCYSISHFWKYSIRGKVNKAMKRSEKTASILKTILIGVGSFIAGVFVLMVIFAIAFVQYQYENDSYQLGESVMGVLSMATFLLIGWLGGGTSLLVLGLYHARIRKNKIAIIGSYICPILLYGILFVLYCLIEPTIIG